MAVGGAGGGQDGVAPDPEPPGPMSVSSLGDSPACLSRTSDAELRPAALYLMLDSSGSMLEPAGGATKWDSVRSAIRGFLTQDAARELLHRQRLRRDPRDLRHHRQGGVTRRAIDRNAAPADVPAMWAPSAFRRLSALAIEVPPIIVLSRS